MPPGLDSDVALEAAAGRISQALARPFALDELSLNVAASIGAARFPDDGPDASALLRCADVAMYAAKDAQAEYKLYAVEQNHHSVRRLSVLSDFRRALAEGGIEVYYQPIMALADRSIQGAEALVRWRHPERGLLTPGDFIATVEQTDLVGPLSRYVLEVAVAACASWRRRGHAMSVAVNLSARNLLDRDLPDDIARILDAAGVPAEALSLEITERMIMSDPERAIANIVRMSSLGIRLSVDDFGTGYFSLANLRRLPIDDLKLDRSFVSPMLHSESDLIIVRSTINLGYDLGLRITAEGVEDGATLERLALLGCDLGQGFHIGAPMDATAFDLWLSGGAADGRAVA
jgi:EAL domain-containing protein (putative c-di-GMP-specific phosphodiesterase class I)